MGNKPDKKFVRVDFQRLENRSYKTLTNFEKQIVDKIIELNTPKDEEPEEKTAAQEALLDMVKEAMKELTSEQKMVLDLLFGLTSGVPISEREVGLKLKISHQSVHGLKERALNKLRKICEVNQKALQNIKSKKA